MNILYLINHAGKGGAEKYVEILADAMIKKGATVFCIYNETGELKHKMSALGVPSIRIDMKSPTDMEAAAMVAEFCKRLEIDIIHTQFARENYIAIRSKRFYRTPTVIHTSHINIKNNILWKISNKFVTRHNSAVIAVCNSVKSLLIANNYPKDKIQVIFNGVEYKEKAEKKYPTTDQFTFVTLTRLSQEKGILFLLESAKKLKSTTNKDFKLLIAGDGVMFDEADEFIKQNNLTQNIELLGHIQNTEEILEKSHAFINSSSSEALSFAILEAMSQGLPVIATEVGGNPDIINSNTNCGVLVKYNDTEALAQAMQTLMEDNLLYEKYSSNATKAVRDTFNIEKTVESTYQLYKIQGGNNDR